MGINCKCNSNITVLHTYSRRDTVAQAVDVGTDAHSVVNMGVLVSVLTEHMHVKVQGAVISNCGRRSRIDVPSLYLGNKRLAPLVCL